MPKLRELRFQNKIRKETAYHFLHHKAALSQQKTLIYHNSDTGNQEKITQELIIMQNQYQQLSNLEKKYYNFFSNAPVGIIVLDKFGVIKDYNHYGAYLLNLDFSRSVTYHFMRMIARDYFESFYQFFKKMVKMNSDVSCIVKLNEKLLKNRYFKIDGVKEQDPNDLSSEIFILILTDISELKNEESSQQNNEKLLITLLDQKSISCRIYHHFLRSNLNYIKFYLKRIAESPTSTDVIDKIDAIIELNENLAKTNYSSKRNFRYFVMELTRILLKAYKPDHAGISFHYCIEESYFTYNVTVPLGIIISEIVKIMLQFSFTGKFAGVITLSFFYMGSHSWKLIINDNGLAFDDNIFPLKSESISIKLIQKLLMQIEGTMTINHLQGTEITIIFKDYKHL